MSVGYDTYFPSNAYGIDYYRIEVSANPSDFQNLVVSVTCSIGQTNSVCNFDRRVASIVGLSKAVVYYYRIMAGTIVGIGQNSTTVASPTIAGAPAAPVAVNLTSTEVSAGAFTYDFAFQAPADTGAGTSVLAIVYYVQVSGDNFSTVVASATLTSAYAGGLQQNMLWTLQAYPNANRTTYSFRVRAANYFDTLGASGPFSDVLSAVLPAVLPGCNAGYTGPDGGPCSACPTGTWKSATGSGSCTGCPFFSGGTCTPCTDSTACLCNAGYSGPDGGSCTACVAATYKSGNGSQACTSCPANSGSLGTALTVCPCDAGFTGPDGACEACAVGTHKSAPGPSACEACPENTTSALASSSCVCDKGYYDLAALE